MREMRPAEPDEVDHEVRARIDERAGETDGSDPWRSALLRTAVDSIRDRLGRDEALARFAVEAEADEDTSNWSGARHQASEIGRTDNASIAVLFMLAEKTTSGEEKSPYFRALGAAAATAFGATVPTMTGRTKQLHEAYGELFSRMIEVQRGLTATLLGGLTEVSLHRGDVVAEAPATETADPDLWPLASFATDWATANAFAIRKNDRVAGVPVVYSAWVPLERLVATPATGFAVAIEQEVVVGAGARADLATVRAVQRH